MKDRKERQMVSSNNNVTPSLVIFSVFLFLIPTATAYPTNTQINFILNLVNNQGNSIPDAVCTGYVWNSDMATINQTLSLSYSIQTQVYFTPFTTPDTVGQYLQTANCTLTNGRMAFDKKTFEVESNANVNIDEKLTSINNTVKNVNNTIMTKLYLMQDEITSVNNTVKNESYYTNNNIDYWGSINTNTTNYQGDRIWNFLQNMTFGGNVTANVDYDEIAMRVIMYMKGFKVWEWWPTSIFRIG